MKSSVNLGRLWGIPIGLSYSWFLVFALVTWSLAAGVLPSARPGLATEIYILQGLITSVLFFASVLAHELGHAYLARRNDVPVRSISLFFFGGVAEITREPKTAGAEFRIAIAGPLVSIGLAALFGALAVLAQGNPYLAVPNMWLARINLFLALFNMLPGFPLDGGRVFRAIVWKVKGDAYGATRIASTVGQVVALGFIGVGVLSALTGNLVNGMWLGFLGLFLNGAALSSRQQAQMQRSLEGVTAGQVMNRSVMRAPSWVTVGDLFTPATLAQGHRAFVLEDWGQFKGVLTLEEAARVPRAQWYQRKVEQVMTPTDRLVTVRPETELADALQVMQETGVKYLPVLEAGAVVGTLGLEQVQNYLRAQQELAGRGQRRNKPAARGI